MPSLLPLILLFASAAAAHEIGTTRVTARFHLDRSFEISVATDAESLAEKFEALAGRELAAPVAPERLFAIIRASDELFRQRVKIAFDEVAVQPSIDHSLELPAIIIRFTGRVPDGVQRFHWSYGWTFTTYSLSVNLPGAAQPRILWLEGGSGSTVIDLGTFPALGPLTTFRRYLTLGFTHIVPHGLDHMLFVVGLCLLSCSLRSVLLQVSAFTVAHSVTLGLGMYGLVRISPSVVEPLIAISIAWVAIENVFLSELRPWRIALVFAFGLLHGLGFAGALAEVGLPRGEFVTALAGFNVGVEAGQLAVIIASFLLLGWRFSRHSWYRPFVVVPASVAIASVALYWSLDRLR
jgi:hypothetical protein